MPTVTNKSKKKQKGGNDAAVKKATHQSTLGNMFKKMPKYERFIDADILYSSSFHALLKFVDSIIS